MTITIISDRRLYWSMVTDKNGRFKGFVSNDIKNLPRSTPSKDIYDTIRKKCKDMNLKQYGCIFTTWIEGITDENR